MGEIVIRIKVREVANNQMEAVRSYLQGMIDQSPKQAEIIEFVWYP